MLVFFGCCFFPESICIKDYFILFHTRPSKQFKKFDVFVISQKCYRLHTIFIKHLLGIAYFVNKEHSFQNCPASFCLIVS